MAKPAKVAVIGECMVELGRQNNVITQTYGGDTFNMAVYLKRASDAKVDYITAVGKDDPYSNGMLEFMTANGVDCGLAQRLEGKLPGLYAINVDEQGERSFCYWRGDSAARDCFETEEGDAILSALWSYDLAHISGITLAVLRPTGREKLLQALEKAADRGVNISFDFNYRPNLWVGDSAEFFRRAAAISRWLFLSPQELAGAGYPDLAMGTPELARAIASLGARETIIRNGCEPGAVLIKSGGIVPFAVEKKLEPVDTTAAGDAFTGAYLGAALAGKQVQECVRAGQKMAEAVIMRPGAIIPASETPELYSKI